ncbi:pyrroline-5-carboxylate reductase [Methylocapsa sp. D3K7]|uniref:pyrroline-5-carboxylate reductase n=1 Tax=Methylocapsa sp. D3K7 TaxID=3041435 RepID=UPI00244EC66D|nr:pyrroline-5-carboxylate reductase [Methylocapsa sp. D3K7]WGJ13964.1 pyrroline-5-carboxylate reductase [Methylocapsa sp. D3K7]
MPSPGADRFKARLLLAGAGKMGGAMLRAWLDRGYEPDKIHVLEPHPSPEIFELARDRGFALGAPSIAPDILVLAIKPQSLDEAAPGLTAFASPATLVISILAGKTIANIAAKLPQATAIIRAMPNLAAAVGRGVTVLTANPAATPAQRAAAESLLAATGVVEWLADEALIDAATAVSGSGPAYVFYLAEVLASAGTSAGLPAEIAARLARATVEGSGELLFRSSGKSPAELRENVTSRGGVTAAALEILMAPDGLEPLLERAVKAAQQRARSLAG